MKGTKTFTFRTPIFGTMEGCTFEVGKYQNGNPQVGILDGEGKRVVCITRNIPWEMKGGFIVLDLVGDCRGVDVWVRTEGIAKEFPMAEITLGSGEKAGAAYELTEKGKELMGL